MTYLTSDRKAALTTPLIQAAIVKRHSSKAWLFSGFV